MVWFLSQSFFSFRKISLHFKSNWIQLVALKVHWNCSEVANWKLILKLTKESFDLDETGGHCSETALELHWNRSGIALWNLEWKFIWKCRRLKTFRNRCSLLWNCSETALGFICKLVSFRIVKTAGHCSGTALKLLWNCSETALE